MFVILFAPHGVKLITCSAGAVIAGRETRTNQLQCRDLTRRMKQK